MDLVNITKNGSDADVFYAFFYQGYTYYFCPPVQDHVLPPKRIKGNHCDKKWTYHDLFNFYWDKSKPILENCKVRASPKEDYFILMRELPQQLSELCDQKREQAERFMHCFISTRIEDKT